MMELHTSFLYSRIVFKCLSPENRRERQIAVNGNIFFFQFAEGMWILKHARLLYSQLHPKMYSENKTNKTIYFNENTFPIENKAFRSIYFENIIFLQ